MATSAPSQSCVSGGEQEQDIYENYSLSNTQKQGDVLSLDDVQKSDRISPKKNSKSCPPPQSPRQHILDNEEDYFSIDDCYAEDDNVHTPHTHPHPVTNAPASCDSSPQRISIKSQRLDSDNGTSQTILLDTNTSQHTTPNILSTPSNYNDSSVALDTTLHNAQTVGESTGLDYENSDVIDSQLERYSPKHNREYSPNHEREFDPSQESDYANSDIIESQLREDSQKHNRENNDPDYENEEDVDEELSRTDIKNEKVHPPEKLSTQQINPNSASNVSHPLVGNDRGSPVVSDPVPNKLVQITYKPKRNCSTLHRESEIKIEVPESPNKESKPLSQDDSEAQDQFDPTILNRTPSYKQKEAAMLSSMSSLMMTEKVKSSRGAPALSRGSSRRQPIPGPDLSKLGTFERALLQTNGPTTQAMPNMAEIPWYHEGITRHIAESLLLSKTIRDGTYLLRDSVHSNESLTLSVRCQNSVKHYRILWEGNQFSFGLGKFPTLESLKEHFHNKPIISGDSGVLVQLMYPYPRGVAEPAIYFEPVVHTITDDKSKSPSANGLTTPTSDVDKSFLARKWTKKEKASSRVSTHSLPDLSINSKEGYLTKMGARVKNWKKRWFVLYRNEFKYFQTQDNKEPIRVIDLNDVSAVDRDDSAGKPHCFRLVTSYRTFFMYATSDVEANEWVQILDWKLGKRSRSNSRVQ